MSPATVLGAIIAGLAIIALALFFSFWIMVALALTVAAIFVAFIAFMVTPTAPDSMPITVDNFNAFQMYSREYHNATDHIRKEYLFEPMKAKVTKRISGNLALRSTEDGLVYAIDIKDDKAFGMYGEGVDKMKLDNKEFSWALSGCRNNTKGCHVTIDITYSYFLDYKIFFSQYEVKRK